TRTAGLVQIRDYASANDIGPLLIAFAEMNRHLKSAKNSFYELISAPNGVNYFGAREAPDPPPFSIRTPFDNTLAKRLAVASLLVATLHDDRNFGRTKFAKLFYLSDLHGNLALEAEYAREAAGPLDQRSLYNQRIGIEALGQKYRFFRPETV